METIAAHLSALIRKIVIVSVEEVEEFFRVLKSKTST